MKSIITFIIILATTISFTQEETLVADSIRSKVLNIQLDTNTQDSSMMSHAEIYDYFYYKKVKFPQCMVTVDSLVKQSAEKSLQIKDLKINVATWTEKFNTSQKVAAERQVQLKIEQTKNRKKIWAIVGGTFGGLVTGFIIGWAVSK